MNQYSASNPISIILADDHSLVRGGLRALLEDEREFKVVDEASNGEEALKKIVAQQPDIAIMDIRMPMMTGIEAIQEMKALNVSTNAIVLSMHNSKECVINALKAGALGYLLKDTTKSEFIKAIRKVHQGGKYFSADISSVVVDEYLRNPHTDEKEEIALTNREKEILNLVLAGLTNREISTRLEKSVRTIETHRFNLMKKLDVNNIGELRRKIKNSVII